MREQSVPGDVVSLMTYLFTEVLDGRNARGHRPQNRRCQR
jgi:hypothetical protein